jgi:type I restriction enzyme, S subunit
MSELPGGWTNGKLQDCAKVLDNLRVPVNSEERNKRQGNIPYYGATGQVGCIDDFLFDEELLLIGEDGAPFFDKTKPIAYIIRGKSWVNNHAHVLRAKSELTSNLYLKYFLDQFNFHEYVNGTTRLKLTQGSMNEIPVKLAPFNEQRRIVAKLEKLSSRVDAAQARLAAIPRILKRFRQSVLGAACSGKLTADWRGGNGDEPDGLPSGWQRVEVERLVPKGGIFDGPFGSNLKTSDYRPSGVRVVRLENVGHLSFIGEKETYVSQEKYQTLVRHTVREGDVIFASFISDEIRACILPQLPTKAIAKADCFCLRPKKDLLDSTYLTYQLVSQETFDALIDNIHGATRPRINTTQLRALRVRVCPLTEQQEIVRRVKALFKTADALEARYRTAKAHVDKLTQSILAKAFRGELVPQDPNDERASVLLERIRQERNGAPIAKAKPTRKNLGK